MQHGLQQDFKGGFPLVRLSTGMGKEREKWTGHTGKNDFHLNEHPREKKLSEKKNVNKDGSCIFREQ